MCVVLDCPGSHQGEQVSDLEWRQVDEVPEGGGLLVIETPTAQHGVDLASRAEWLLLRAPLYGGKACGGRAGKVVIRDRPLEKLDEREALLVDRLRRSLPESGLKVLLQIAVDDPVAGEVN